MTRTTLSCALVALLAFAAAATAEAQALKIGFVNFGRLLDESPQAKAAQATLEAEFLPRQRDVAAQRKSLQEKVDKLQKEAAVMSEADRLRAEREARDLELNVNRRFNELQEDLNLRRNEEVGKMQRALLQEVQAYARANGYQLIVSEGVLFAADGVDITPQVVAAIKSKAPAAATPPKPSVQSVAGEGRDGDDARRDRGPLRPRARGRSRPRGRRRRAAFARRPGKLTFCTGAKYRKELAATRAVAVVLARELAGDCPVAALVSPRPYADYARIAQALHPLPAVTGGRAPGAQVAPTAQVAASAWIGPNAVIGAGAVVGERCSIGPNCVVGEGVLLGDDSRLQASVTLHDGVVAGRRCNFKAGAVVGSDGFGFAPDADGYVKVPHVGGVRLGDDVEVGANTTVDRGTIDDTIIGDGVKLDNQVQVGHNCRIGAHTVIAGCVGISGSSIIGSRCMIGGAVGIAGHLEIGDGVVVTGYSLVTHSLPGPGVYSSGWPAIESGKWRRAVARLHRLDARRPGAKDLQGDE